MPYFWQVVMSIIHCNLIYYIKRDSQHLKTNMSLLIYITFRHPGNKRLYVILFKEGLTTFHYRDVNIS